MAKTKNRAILDALTLEEHEERTVEAICYVAKRNNVSLILDQFRGVPCLVTAEFSHTVIPPEERSTDPMERLKQIARNQTFKRLIIEPDLEDM
jgi:hypothetical protein